MIFNRFVSAGVLSFALVLAGCQSSQSLDMADSKPLVPQKQYPKLPVANVLEAQSEDSEKVVLAIDAGDLEKANITNTDLERGWYLGEERRYGTPDSWVFGQKDGQSAWMSEAYIKLADEDSQRKVCEESRGRYRLACAESDSQFCEHEVVETRCDCPERTSFHSWEQGCLLFDELTGKYPLVTPEQIRQGFYPGFKLLGTPGDWIHFKGEKYPKSLKDEPGWRSPYL